MTLRQIYRAVAVIPAEVPAKLHGKRLRIDV